MNISLVYISKPGLLQLSWSLRLIFEVTREWLGQGLYHLM